VGTFTHNLTNQGGTLAPGHSAGTTTIVGSYTQQNGAALQIEIGGNSPGTGYDVVNLLSTINLGMANLGGELRLALLGGFVPSASTNFTVLTAPDGIAGAFSNVANGQRLTTTDGNGSFQVNYGLGSAFDPNQIVLSSFAAVPLPGDYNHNNVVDGADYVVWRNTVGQTGAGLPADGNGNNQIDNGDFNVWRSHFGQMAGSGAALPSAKPLSAAAPEPAVAPLMLILGILATCCRRRLAVP
jgi:hypothetical protein